MSIEERTVFTTQGRDFPSLEKAQEFREDMIGEFLDKIPGCRLDREDALRVVAYLVKHRKQVRNLLDY